VLPDHLYAPKQQINLMHLNFSNLDLAHECIVSDMNVELIAGLLYLYVILISLRVKINCCCRLIAAVRKYKKLILLMPWSK